MWRQRRQGLVLVHVPQQTEQHSGSSRRLVPSRLGPRLADALPDGLGIGARPMQQQLTDRRIAITDEAVTPGFRPMLPRFELPRIELQRFDGLDNRRGVAAPEQLGDVLQLPFAGGVRADVARFIARRSCSSGIRASREWLMAIKSRARDFSSSASRRR